MSADVTHFVEKFGRVPGPQDSSFIRAMGRAGVEPAFIYAFWKTGILIIEPFAEDQLSEQDLKIWDEAVCEYMDLTEDGYVITRLM